MMQGNEERLTETDLLCDSKSTGAACHSRLSWGSATRSYEHTREGNGQGASQRLPSYRDKARELGKVEQLVAILEPLVLQSYAGVAEAENSDCAAEPTKK